MTDLEYLESQLIDDTLADITDEAERGRSVVRLGTPVRRQRHGTRRMRGRRRSMRIAEEFEGQLSLFIDPMLDDIRGLFLQEEYSGNVNASMLQIALQNIFQKWAPYFRKNATRIARRWAMAININDRFEIERMLARAFGINTAAIFDSGVVADVIDQLVNEATALIKSVPDELYRDIGNAVVADIRGEIQPEGRSLVEQIQYLTGHTEKRARLIARDQASKIHIGIQQARQESLGIEKYVWRTSKDERVVGNPSGKYPKGNKVHGNHYEREGKVFYWNAPPEDGPPGYSINCRCYAEPILDYSKLNLA